MTLSEGGSERPVIFCLHNLGGSAREWAHVGARLKRARCVALDLPGFGDAARTPGYTVTEMVATIARTIASHAPQRWLLAGHSMGAKVAAVLAREVEDGRIAIAGLEGLVMCAGSPPSPEPMEEDQRRAMIARFSGDEAARRSDAREYVAENSGEKLSPDDARSAEGDALRMDRAAWVAWLESGSREDWSDRVGVLRTPALVLAGERDGALGPSAQRTAMAPHFSHVRSETLAKAKHLLPLECADEVARLIDEHVAAIERGDFENEESRAETIEAAYRRLIASPRVSGKTREALEGRGRPDDPHYRPVAMNEAALETLRAMLERVIPQDATPAIDLAARIDAQLASTAGDGWRFAELPSDAEAFRRGLETLDGVARRLHGRAFRALDGGERDEMLTSAAAGTLRATDADVREAKHFGAEHMRAWFEDVRAEAARAYVGHPSTLARIGYSGIAYGGDGEPKTGFARVGPGDREAWEPSARAEFER